ncbi:MAG: signal peptidase I [Desulfobulbus sp.]|nr:MAG: signal peptidase I [Desulfobulbus sp.]
MSESPTATSKSTLREYTEAIIIALVLAFFIRTFIVQAFKIPSGSMLPTLLIGDHLLVNKFTYGVRLPFTGTVLVPINTPEHNDVIVFKYPQDPKLDYIKRVVAVGGDTIESRDKVLYLNGKPFDDKYGVHMDDTVVDRAISPRDNFGPLVVPEGKVFVMGDNRDNSYDSRFWGFVDHRAILGKAFIIYWSWDVQRPLLSLDRFQSIRFGRFGDIIH